MSGTGVQDRCRGVLLGLAAGDRNGGPIRMAVRLAESLLELGRFDPQDIVARYLRWWRAGAFDTGPVRGRALELMAAGMSSSEASAQVHQEFAGQTAGCNPAHRSPPLAMLASLADDDLSHCAITEARLTHHDALAADVAAAATPPISCPLSNHPHNLTESAPRKRPFCAFAYRPHNRLQGGAPCWF
jgi:ADP-ribosylglycohydrolase